MTRDLAIAATSLRKTFGRKVAVADLTLEVRRGEVYGFLGPNGAGKSTSLKMFLGLVRPTAGSAQLLGEPAGDIAVRGRIGFLPEQFRFHDWLTAGEFLAFHGSLYGLEPPRIAKQSGELLERLGLSDHLDKRLREFSKGMLQRVGIAQALLAEPELILLDEPTSGLDPGGRRLVRDLILEQRRAGRTVFVNSHLLSEIEVTCDRVAFIKHGRVLKTRELNGALRGSRQLTATVHGITAEMLDALRYRVESVHLAGEQLTLRVKDKDSIPEIARYLAAQCDVYSLTSGEASLEELFLEIIGPEAGL